MHNIDIRKGTALRRPFSHYQLSFRRSDASWNDEN